MCVLDAVEEGIRPMKTHKIRQDSTATFALKSSVRSVVWSCAGKSKLIAGRVLLLSLLLLTLSGSVFAEDSCSLEEVKVGFQAKTCPFFDYEFTLNGTVASGLGTMCHSFEIFPNLTNKAWASLKVDKTYVLEGGTGLCITQVNFDVPQGYSLFIDGIETNTIIKTNGGIIFSGDGEWEIVVRKKCDCGANDAAQTSQRNGSVVWEAGMGYLKDGRSAERLSIREKVLSSAIYTPAALIYSRPEETSVSDVEVLRDGTTLRQVKAPQALADVFVNTPSEYEIRYYRPADVGPKSDGFYTFLGPPYVTWRITNPDPTTTTQLEIHKVEGGIVTNKTQYTWDPAIDSWTLKTGWISGLNYARTETRTVSYPTTTSRTETYIVKEGNTLVSKRTETFLSFPWGEELVQEVLDPDSAALTTTYTYYENPSETNRYRKVKTITYPDGLWEKYEYDEYWNIRSIMRPWKDLSMASATESNSHMTIYGYTNSDNGVFGVSQFPRILFDVEEKIAGVTVRKTRYNRSIVSVDPDITAVTESNYATSTEGVPSDLVTESIATVYRFSAPEFLANRLDSMTYADGRKESYTYEKGDYVTNADPALNQFVPNANGLSERSTLVNGTTTSPAGIAFKTTKETTIRDQFGNEVYHETYVYNGTGYERIGWTESQYDGRGHLLSSRNHKGELMSAVWNGDKKISEIDAKGVETVYEYDTLDQIKTATKKGIAAAGGFPAQGDIKTTFTYDAEGNQTKEKIEGGTLSLISEQTYDRAGRLVSEKDSAGLFTSYSYTNGGRTETVTRPGGATEITENYLDRQVKSVTGSATVAETTDYGVNADGTRYTQEFQGSAGLSSPRWTKTTHDWVDREIKVERPSFTASNLILTLTYNSLGQLQKRVTTANAVKVVADKLFEYDELGRESRRGLDVDASNSLTLVSTDRLTETSIVYEKVGNDWFLVTTNKSYLADNNGTPIVVTQRERLNNFPLNGTEQTVAEITEIDAAGNSTVTTTKVDRAAKKTTITTDDPDSDLNATDVRINGLLQSSTPSTPSGAITYTYDSLGRRIGTTDPATGTTSRSYSTDTGQLTSQTEGQGTANFEYHPATHVAAGRLKAQINAAGKRTYFNYNGRGQKIQTWGDGTYPLEYVYDAYGQLTELHTYRSGQNWGSSVWPSSTTGPADLTRWTHHESTGLLTQKEDAALKGAAYTYDELGRTKTRVWARGITTTYGYDANTGELRTVTYDDSTPALAYTYDRGGRQTNITDAAGARTRTYSVEDDLLTEQITGGVLDGVSVTVGLDSFLRRTSVQSAHNTTTLSNQSYGYDASSRLQTVTSGSQTATYGYHPTSGLLTSTSFTGGTNIARSYDSFGRIENITTTPAAGTPQSYVYQHNNLNQRTRVTREDGSYWSFVYNDRGELVTGKKYWSDNSLVHGNQTEFAYDTSGNRTTAKAGGNQVGALRQSAYTANNLNQYSQRTVPGAVDVTGLAHSSASVTVNNLTTARKGDYFYKELTVDNSSAPSYPQISVVGARNNFGAGGEDAVTEKGGRAFLPPAVESFSYDFDGNLINDGRWLYSWNAENRLIGMEAAANVPVEAKKKLEFNYDHLGRRILKKVSVWNAGTSQYELQSETKFVYDGWTPIAELAGNNSLIRSYVWGSDLSDGLEDAGSVGGLLLVDEGGNRYQAGYDGNGNVTTLVNAATGAIASSYEYDPFGNTLKATGDYANTNPFRFSTKYTDQESGLVYYGYRFYNPQTGKWLSKDPLEEAGGINLYAFNTNDSVNEIDYLGLRKKHKRSKKGTGHHIIPWSLFNGKVNNAVYEFFNSEFARIWHKSYAEHNAKALNGISHKEYTGLVKQELKKFLGNKRVRQMTIEEAETFLHRIKNMPHSNRIRQFNDGVLDEAAESIARKLGRGTRGAAKSSLMRALKIGAKRVPRGLSLLSTVVSFAFIAEDVMANGVEKAIDNEVRETGRQADSFVQSVIRVWERGTIQHYGKKLVELCDIGNWW